MSHGHLSPDVIAPQSRFYHGPFGRMFPDLEPWAPDVPEHRQEAKFLKFANRHMVEKPSGAADDALPPNPTEIANDRALREALDREFDSRIPSAYTFFGQFIDHDITLDVTPLSESEVDPNRLHNFRTPRLDLDCIYGTGPDDQPYLYEHNGGFTGRMITGTVTDTNYPDLQRNKEGGAIIGDMRNDENAMVAQVQLAFILAHNRLVDVAKAIDPSISGDGAFRMARRSLRWLYQYVVWNDFLRRVTHKDVHECALKLVKACGKTRLWDLGLKHIYNWKENPFMPVEFSVAAYRFGHSMVRNSYLTNENADLGAGADKYFPIFDNSGNPENDLAGFRFLKKQHVLQWNLHLEMKDGGRPQYARKVDTKLANALAFLREDPDNPGSVLNILAARNLLRGVRMKLPSGPAVARKLGLDVTNLGKGEPEALWFYILKEAEVECDGKHLARLGSSIVCATFAGLLKGDPTSWLNVWPEWEPEVDPLLSHASLSGMNMDTPGTWGLPAIIRMSGLPVDAGDL
ncbi:MAG: hypothetical protein EP335_09755 [Alphaproteobacteria bacterium]|nr:MAG: hypothetical protein EP335_09755 [Alphaproteobacteria bacterium]